jgi:hypothetical protein
MNKVYIVTSGDKSDHCINAVFSTRELADEYVAKMNTPGGDWEKPQIEVFVVDAEKDVVVRELFAVEIDGHTCEIKNCSRGLNSIVHPDYVPEVMNFNRPDYTTKANKVIFFAQSYESLDHAVAMAKEARIRYLNGWLEGEV